MGKPPRQNGSPRVLSSGRTGPLNKINLRKKPPKPTRTEVNRTSDLNQARRLSQLEYGPQQQALKSANQASRRDMEYNLGLIGLDKRQDTRTQKAYGELADNRIQQIYGALQQQLGQGAQAQQALHGNAMTQVAQNSDQAIQSAQGATDRVRQQMEAEAQRLGLTEGLKDPLTKFSEEMEGARTRATGSGVSAINNLLTRGTDVAVNNIDQGMDTARQGAQERTNLLNKVQGTLGKISEDYGRESGDLRHESFNERLGNREQMNNLAQMRGVATSAAFRELQDARTERQRQRALDKLSAQIQRGTLELQQNQLGHTKRMDNKQLDLARDQFGFEKKAANRAWKASEAQRRFNNTMAIKDDSRRGEQHQANLKQMQAAMKGDTLSKAERVLMQQEIRKTQAEIRKINSETRRNNSDARGETENGEPKKYEHRQGVVSYLKDTVPKPQRKQVMTSFENILNDVGGLSNEAGAARRRVHDLARERRWPKRYTDTMLRVMDIYFNKDS